MEKGNEGPEEINTLKTRFVPTTLHLHSGLRVADHKN